MKTIRTIIVSSALLISAAHANLIDLTPGGFDPGQGLPPAFHRLQTHVFFDTAAHGVFGPPPTYYDGWISQYGALNGGTYFFTNLFDLGDTPTASIWWNFNGAPNGYWLSTIDVFGRRADGTPWENIYGVPRGDRFISPSDQLVIVDGFTTIMGISFYGLNPETVPDKVNTGALLLLAVSAVFVCGKIITGRKIQVIGGTRETGPRRIICPTERCNAMPIDWVQPTDEFSSS